MPHIPALKANKVSDHKTNQMWPDHVRRKVVKTWLQTGSVTLTSQICKIPFDTVENWRYKSSWWKDYVRRYREEADASMAGRIEKLLNKSVEQLEDRVQNGEEVYDQREGTTKRVKMKARDLNTTVKVLSDRHDVLTDRAKNEAQATEQINDKLSKLATAFEKFAKKGTSSFQETQLEDITDVEYSEVIPSPTPEGDNAS